MRSTRNVRNLFEFYNIHGTATEQTKVYATK